MKYLFIVILLFYHSFISAQITDEDSSFIDEIDLTLGVDGGILKTSHYVEQLKDFTYQGAPVDQNIPFGFAPVFTVRAGLRGFGFDLFAFVRNSFLNYGAEGQVYIKDGMGIFSVHQELLEWGFGFYYNINTHWSAGLLYSRYTGEMRGQEEIFNMPRPTSSISLDFSFKQVKAYAAYKFTVNEHIHIPLSAEITLYSNLPYNLDRILIEFPDQHRQYSYGYNGKPFNLIAEAGVHFDFALTPVLRYEYLSIGSSYNIHIFSILLRWIIPADH